MPCIFGAQKISDFSVFYYNLRNRGLYETVKNHQDLIYLGNLKFPMTIENCKAIYRGFVVVFERTRKSLIFAVKFAIFDISKPKLSKPVKQGFENHRFSKAQQLLLLSLQLRLTIQPKLIHSKRSPFTSCQLQ